MARRADELVREIRARRRNVKQAVEDLLSTHELARRIRRDPWAWLAGGAAAGMAVGRFLPRPLLEGARRSVHAVLVPRLRTALAGIVTAALAARGNGDEPPEDGAA